MKYPQNFQGDVLNVLRNGSPEFRDGLTTFTGPGGDFENTQANKVRAFIITPYRDHAVNPARDDVQFPAEVTRIKDLLTNILGRSDTLTIPYFPAGRDDDNRAPKGKIYIQYDPAVAALVPTEGGCNQQQAAAIEIWFEDALTYR